MTTSTSLLEPPAVLPDDPPAELQAALLDRGDDLSVLPAVAAEALELAKDPDCSIEQFSTLVERDLKLASDILAMANSALHSGGVPISSLSQAVTRLGFTQCKNLILTSSLTSLMRRLSLDQAWIRDILWRHSLTVAIHCHHLNRALGCGFLGEEFTSGLIHDLGRTLLAIAVPDRFSEFDPLSFDEAQDVLAQEQAAIGTDHARYGAWFIRRSGLPDSLVDVVRNHHDCENASRLTALTAAADDMANHLQRYQEPDQYVLESNAGIARLTRLGMKSAERKFRENAVEILEESARDLVELTRRMR